MASAQASEWAETKQILAELRQCYQGTAGEVDDAKLVGEIKAQNAKASRVIEERKANTKQVIQGAWMATGCPRCGSGEARDEGGIRLHMDGRGFSVEWRVCVIVVCVSVVRLAFVSSAEPWGILVVTMATTVSK